RPASLVRLLVGEVVRDAREGVGPLLRQAHPPRDEPGGHREILVVGARQARAERPGLAQGMGARQRIRRRQRWGSGRCAGHETADDITPKGSEARRAAARVMSLALLVYTLRPMPPERRLFIDGKLRETGRTMPVVSPYDGREVARVHLGSENDMEDATQAAQRGFKAMATLSRGERAGILRRVAEGVRKRGDEIASTMTAEMGKPIQYSRAEVARCVTTFTLAAEEAG